MTIDWSKLGTGELPPDVLRYLKERGVPKSLARANNVRALTAKECARVGWSVAPQATGILFPGARTARILGQPAARGKFRFAADEGARIYIPKQPKDTTREALREDVSLPLILGEGPTRPLAATAVGLYGIGVPGCWNWQKNREPLPTLRRFVWKGREVMPVFDADVFDNLSVGLSYVLLGDWLTEQGAKVIHLQLPKVAGRKTGFDDFLAAKGRKGFDALRRQAWDHSKAIDKLRITVQRKTEGGLAALFTMQSAEDVRFDQDVGVWLVYNGHLFQRQEAVALDVQEQVKQTVLSIYRDASTTKNADRRKALTRWAAACDRKAVIRNAMDLAKSDSRLRVRSAELDADPYLLGVSNGVLDLRTGQLTAASRAQLVTRSMAASFDAKAKCPKWRRFIKEIMCGDAKMIAFMQRLAGYLLIGHNRERLIFFLYGIGRNGKSAFIETLGALFGDYGVAAKAELIGRGRFDRDAESAQPFKMSLRGKRYITASEVREGMPVDGAELKTLTGGDATTARGLHAAPVQFTVTGKIVFRCNHRPIIDNADQAIWDRVVEIPFAYRVPDNKVNLKLMPELAEELPGILAWAVRGALRYNAKGLRLPGKVKRQTRAYRAAMDPIADWLKQCTRADESERTRRKDVYASYLHWCSRQQKPDGTRGISPLANDDFNKKLEALGYTQGKNNSLRYWQGLALSEDAG